MSEVSNRLRCSSLYVPNVGMRYKNWSVNPNKPDAVYIKQAFDKFCLGQIAHLDQMLLFDKPLVKAVVIYMEAMRQFFRGFGVRQEIDLAECITFSNDVLRWHLKDNYMIDFDRVIGK